MSHSTMESKQCEDGANNQNCVLVGECKPLSSYQGVCTFVMARKPDVHIIMVEHRNYPTIDGDFLHSREQMEEGWNMHRTVCGPGEMEVGILMVEETKVERCLRQICYSLFVTIHEKGMVNVLFGYHGWEHNPIVWAMKKYPKSKYIQLYGICAIINAIYCSKSAEHNVADLKCIQVIVTVMKEFSTKEFFENGVLAIENIIDEDWGNASLLVNKLKNNIDFICEVVMNNGANLLLSLSAELWNAIILELILKYSKE